MQTASSHHLTRLDKSIQLFMSATGKDFPIPSALNVKSPPRLMWHCLGRFRRRSLHGRSMSLGQTLRGQSHEPSPACCLCFQQPAFLTAGPCLQPQQMKCLSDQAYSCSVYKKSNLAHTCHPRTWEVEAEESRVQDQPQLHTEFKTSLGSMRLSKKKSDVFYFLLQLCPKLSQPVPSLPTFPYFFSVWLFVRLHDKSSHL